MYFEHHLVSVNSVFSLTNVLKQLSPTIRKLIVLMKKPNTTCVCLHVLITPWKVAISLLLYRKDWCVRDKKVDKPNQNYWCLFCLMKQVLKKEWRVLICFILGIFTKRFDTYFYNFTFIFENQFLFLSTSNIQSW